MTQPGRHRLQQLIPDGMTERIVDTLEFVDVDVEHGELTATLDTLKLQFEPFPEQGAVWQVGERVVVGKMGDLLLGNPSLGDVFMRRHPTTIRRLLMRNLHPASVCDTRDINPFR